MHGVAPMRLGYALSSEEHRPLDLIRYARMAEEAGFEFAGSSDHFHLHPWVDEQVFYERSVPPRL